MSPSGGYADTQVCSCLQGADVRGLLRHQQLLDEAVAFFIEEFEIPLWP